MTKTKALKKLFKKMFNYDANGNSATSVIVDAAENAEMSGGSSLKYVKDDPSDNGGVIEGLVEGEAGQVNVASGLNAHAEGGRSFEGNGTTIYIINTASGSLSHTEGENTIANHKSQHVIGEFNVADSSTAANDQRGNYAFIIGNGTANNARSNALAIKWDGTFVFANGTEITPAQFQSLLALLS